MPRLQSSAHSSDTVNLAQMSDFQTARHLQIQRRGGMPGFPRASDLLPAPHGLQTRSGEESLWRLVDCDKHTEACARPFTHTHTHRGQPPWRRGRVSQGPGAVTKDTLWFIGDCLTLKDDAACWASTADNHWNNIMIHRDQQQPEPDPWPSYH